MQVKSIAKCIQDIYQVILCLFRSSWETWTDGQKRWPRWVPSLHLC